MLHVQAIADDITIKTVCMKMTDKDNYKTRSVHKFCESIASLISHSTVKIPFPNCCHIVLLHVINYAN